MQRRKSKPVSLRGNLIWYYGAICVILLGYISLAIGNADSFASRTLGPVIIVIGYLIAVPMALLAGAFKHSRDDVSDSSAQASTVKQPPQQKLR